MRARITPMSTRTCLLIPKSRSRFISLSLVLLVVLLGAMSLSAQTFRGTILGTVTDPSGAVVPGAKVTVKNTGTGLDRSTETSADGSYALSELPIGTYEVTVTQAGFQTFVATGVTVDVATERRIDAGLKAGQVSTTVQVSADTLPLVETTTNDMGGVLTAKTVEDLPVNGRDYTKLIFLNPGVAGSPDQISDSPGSYGEFSMNGARGRSNNYLLDGTDMNDGYRNDPAINEAGVFGTPSAILPIDAIADVNVISNFQPEFGRNSGAVVNIVTKSGTNRLHGSAGEYFRNDALDARNYFNFAGQPKAQFHNNQYGASLGGPIVKDKTFFYADYEGQQEAVGVVTLGCVPDPAQIAADVAVNGPVNPVIASLLARNPWPAPNIPGTYGNPSPIPGEGEDVGCPNGVPNSSVISPSYNKLTSFIAKIDHSFNPNNTLTGRYFFGDSIQSFPLALTASGGQLPGFNTFTPTRVQLVSISYSSAIGSNKVNELRYGWNRFAEGFQPQDQAFQPSSIGLDTGTGLANGGLPIIATTGFAQLGASSSTPRHRVDSNVQALDNFTWKLNKHDVKVGFDFHRTSVQQYFGKYFRGKLEFDDLSDFLSGTVDGGFQYSGNSIRHTFENNFGLYAQDSFRVSPRLTVNYGLRWDYYGVIGEKNNLLSAITNLDSADDTFTLTQVGQPGLSKLYNPDKTNFAPRISAAWDVTGKGKTVVRAGYGLFYDAFSQDMALGHLPYPPYFDPGPAYNPIGPNPIYSAGVNGNIVSGSPVFGDESACNYECDTFAFDRNIKTPYMENYNINIQEQISSHAVVQVGYVGSQGHRLWRFFDLSQPSNAQVTAADIANAQASTYTVGANSYSCYPGGGPGGNCILSYGVPRNYEDNPYGSFYIMQENSSGESNYHSLQASLHVTDWHGVSSIVNYVWSKSLDNSSDGEDFEPNAAQPNDSTNPQLEYGPSNFNIPQRFTWIFNYQIPKMGGSMQMLKNGWGLGSTVTLQSGQPFQFNYNFEDDFSGSGEGDDRPDVVGPVTYHPHTPTDYVDLSSYAIPCTLTAQATTPSSIGYTGPTGTAQDCVPGTRHFGNEGRDSLHGPTYKNWDFAIYKDTSLGERVKLQLRADFFNLLNHPNFANPFLPAFIADPGAAGFAVSGSGREVGGGGYPLTATGDVGIGNPFLGGGAPRGIQLALKVSF